MKFTIETVSKLTGINAATLRNWEKRYGFPVPSRTASGHRQYDQRDVSFLRIALKLHNEGRALNELSQIYATYELSDPRNENQSSSSGQSPAEILSPAPVENDVEYRWKLIYDSLLKYDVATTAQQWMILNVKLSPSQLFTLVFERILRQLGYEWTIGKVSIPQEHFISNFLRMKLGALLTLDFAAVNEQRFVLATLADERHEGGLLLVGCHLKFRGYPVFNFGIDMPVEALLVGIKECRAGVVGLSYVNGERLRRDLPMLCHSEIPVVLGGIAVMALSDNERDEIRALSPRFFLCFESSSEKAADFLELVSRGTPLA